MKSKKKIFYCSLAAMLLIFYICFSGCESAADLDLSEYNSQLVVTCFFQPDTAWIVDVSLSADAFENTEIEKVYEAQIEIWNKNSRIAVLEHIGDGRYKSNTVQPVENKVYSISVSSPGYESISAEDVIPADVPLISAGNSIVLDTVENIVTAHIEGEFTFDDPPDIRNFYSIALNVCSSLNECQQVFFQTTDDFIWQEIRDNYAVEPKEDDLYYDVVFSDKLFNGQTKTIQVFTEFDITGENIIHIGFSLLNLSKDAYDYRRTTELKLYRANDRFAEPVNIFDNIDNGLGIFAGFNISSIFIDPEFEN